MAVKKIIRNLTFRLFALAVLAVGAVAPALASPAQRGVEQGFAASASTPAKVTPGAGSLLLEAAGESPVRFQVYAVTGQLVKDTTVQPGAEARIDLPKGWYIVRTSASWSVRVLVR